MPPMRNLPEPPLPRDSRTQARWAFTRRSRALLYGEWEQYADERLEAAIGHVRKTAWGVRDMSSNVFRGSKVAQAVLYDRQPDVRMAGAGATNATAFLEVVERSGLWSMMQRVQRDTLGLREMLVRVDVTDESGEPELVFVPVFPDLVEAFATAARPEEPVCIREAVLRWKDGEPVWTWDEYDIRDANNPIFRVLAADGDTDASEEWGLAGLSGTGYYWRDEKNRPFLPYVVYHAQKTGQLFDAFEGAELIEGTLNLCVLWTMFGHAVRNCSWPQRYVINARIAGEQVSEDEGSDGEHREVITDPSVVITLIAEGDVGQVLVGQWEVACDPATLQEAISLYERRVAASGGISPSDVQRVAGDPRSGFAIAITQEAQRAAARRFAPTFSRSDEKLLRIAALLWNLETGGSEPTSGFRVTYAAIPPSPEEQAAERLHLLELLGKGLISRVEVYQRLNPGTDEADATFALAEIAKINRATAGVEAPERTAA